MTDGNVSVTETLHPTRPGLIASHLRLPLDTDEPGRLYRRRRLGVLTAVLLIVLGGVVALAPGGDADVVDVAAASSGEFGFTTRAEGTPVTLPARPVETTTTTAPTAPTTTAAPTTTTTAAPSTTEVAPATTAAPTTAAPTTTSPPTTSPPTTSPPTTSAPTTAPPTTAAPTTQAPAASSDDDYEYGDPRGTQVWLDLAECESNSDWSADTGNGYYGGLQFSLGAWESVGGSGYPHEHPRSTQIEMGRRLQAAQGWGAWPHCSSELELR